MLNVVIPMAGTGSRFIKAGYTTPKPFIPVSGKPMIERVLENLAFKDVRYVLIARAEHMQREQSLVQRIQKEYGAVFIPIDKVTEGAACTVLFARKYIDNDVPLLIANSDQLVDISFESYLQDCFRRELDGSILTFIDPHKDTKWSFAQIDGQGRVTRVKEKEAISEYATVGVYLFSRGKTFVDCAIDMIVRNDRVNDEFYVCPVYNYAIQAGKKIGIYNVEYSQMHGLGTPEDLEKYIRGSLEPRKTMKESESEG